MEGEGEGGAEGGRVGGLQVDALNERGLVLVVDVVVQPPFSDARDLPPRQL